MHFSILLVTVLVTCAIQTHCSTGTNRQFSKIEKRQATNNADQMVQNILEWLQGVYAQNTRRIRQGTVRAYLPPPNSDKPRPFQTGYPPAKYYPEPPFPFPTNPVTGGVTAPEGEDDNLLPPELGSGGGESTRPADHGFTISTEGGLMPGEPSTTSYNGEQPTSEQGPGPFPTHAAGIPEGTSTTLQPGYPTHAGGIPEGGPTTTILEGGPSTTLQPELPTHAAGIPGEPSTTLQPPGYPTHEGVPTTTVQPGYPIHEGVPTTTLQPEYQTHATVPAGQPGFPEGGSTTTSQPGYSTHPPGIPTTVQPGIHEGVPSEEPQVVVVHEGVSTTEQPAGEVSHEGGVPTTAIPTPEGGVTTPEGGGVSIHAGVQTTSQPGYPESSPGVEADHAQPSIAPEEGTSQPSHEGTTGYPAAGQPESTPGVPYSLQPGDQTGTSLQPGAGAGFTHSPQEIPVDKEATPENGETPAPAAEGTSAAPESVPTEPGSVPSEPGSVPSEPGSVPTEPGSVQTEPGSVVPEESSAGPSTLLPSGFTTSTAAAPSETEKTAEGNLPVSIEGTTVGPEANTIPGKAAPIDDDDSKHPPHIHAIDVQCSKEMMTINIEFNREFNGVIYSKGFFNTPECRYVQENSGQTKYTFTVNLDMCGTQFVNGFDTENQSYLENVLVLQNEAGIQEAWDTVRSVRCLWEGNLKDSLSVALSVDMLSQEIVTFSGDTAMAKLDVVLGRGPFGEPANGLVKIGEQMTLVVSVSGDPAFDLQVKDCKAVDSENKNSIALTDEDGCILKPKLFGAFQKTKETGDSGASIIAYAYLNAFKFPDQMDLMIECNIELCKNDCDMCTKEDQQLEPSKRRRRRDVSNSTIAGDWVTMGKLVRVILPEELNKQTALEVTARDHICMSIQGFVFSTAILVSLLVISSFICVCLWMKRREKLYLKY